MSGSLIDSAACRVSRAQVKNEIKTLDDALEHQPIDQQQGGQSDNDCQKAYYLSFGFFMTVSGGRFL